MEKVNGDIVKRYMYRGKMVLITKIEIKDEWIYTFRVSDKCNQRDYYGDRYDTFEECEKDSYKVVKGI